MVLESDGSKTLIRRPTGKPRWEAQVGGLFWVIDFEGGSYTLEAAKFSSYLEQTATPVKNARTETIKRGLY